MSKALKSTATRKTSKSGKPRAMIEEEESLNTEPMQTPEEFVQELFGTTAERQDGLPTLEWLKATYKTKSAAIRYLIYQGFEVKVIAKHLGIRHQHVRNVATTHLKRGPNEDWRPPQIKDTGERD